MSAFRVTLRRRGVSPLTVTLLVGADDAEAASQVAAAVAEGTRGGLFEVSRVRATRADADVLDAIA